MARDFTAQKHFVSFVLVCIAVASLMFAVCMLPIPSASTHAQFTEGSQTDAPR